MDRIYLYFRHGDVPNTILAAARYNYRRLIRWLRLSLRHPQRCHCVASDRSSLKLGFFTDDLFARRRKLIQHAWQAVGPHAGQKYKPQQQYESRRQYFKTGDDDNAQMIVPSN